MARAVFKDLCIDAVDPTVMGRFWAHVLGRDLEVLADGNAVLRGPTAAHTVWINRVPDATPEKRRVHLDVHVRSVDELVDLGARVLDASSSRWTVLADPEGGEFCAFVRDEPPVERLYEVVVDSADHRKIAGWWHEVLGGRLVREAEVSSVERVPGMPFEFLVFGEVPEPKSAKNSVHMDLVCGDRDGLLTLGAVLLRPADDEIRWDVMADPEGNEFCRFDPP